MKILITGAAGFIGSNLVSFLKKRNPDAKFTLIDNLLTGKRENLADLLEKKNISFIQKDLLECEDKINSDEFDLCFHLASPASPPFYQKYPLETIEVNTKGTKLLLDLQKKGRIKTLIFASTSEVYGDPLVHPQPESYWGNVNPVGKRACYDESKRLGETYCSLYHHLFDLDIRIVRIFNTYGPNMRKDDGRVITNLISHALSGKSLPIYGDGSQTRSFCYIDDLLEGLWRFASGKNLAGEIINLGNPDEISIIELAKVIMNLIGKKLELKFLPLPEDDPTRRRPDISKAKEMLNWEPKISLEQGLLQTIKFFEKSL